MFAQRELLGTPPFFCFLGEMMAQASVIGWACIYPICEPAKLAIVTIQLGEEAGAASKQERTTQGTTNHHKDPATHTSD